MDAGRIGEAGGEKVTEPRTVIWSAMACHCYPKRELDKREATYQLKKLTEKKRKARESETPR